LSLTIVTLTETETRTDKDAENVETVTEDQDFVGPETETLTVADNLEIEVESMTEIEQNRPDTEIENLTETKCTSELGSKEITEIDSEAGSENVAMMEEDKKEAKTDTKMSCIKRGRGRPKAVQENKTSLLRELVEKVRTEKRTNKLLKEEDRSTDT
jgi:hypothetical protein